MKKLNAMGLLAGSLLPVAAMAQTTGQAAVDVTGVTATITNQLTSINTVGVAILGLVVLIAAYKWVRRVIR